MDPHMMNVPPDVTCQLYSKISCRLGERLCIPPVEMRPFLTAVVICAFVSHNGKKGGLSLWGAETELIPSF
jgi:hypothetical protein